MENLSISAVVVSGRGIGASLVNKTQEVLSHILGEKVFPGTLNLVTYAPFIFLVATPFDSKHKYYAIPATINDVPCLLSTSASFPSHVFEVIAAQPLRQTLGLEDGAAVTLAVSPDYLHPLTGWRKKIWELLYLGREEVFYKEDVFFVLRDNALFRRISRLISCRPRMKRSP